MSFYLGAATKGLSLAEARALYEAKAAEQGVDVSKNDASQVAENATARGTCKVLVAADVAGRHRELFAAAEKAHTGKAGPFDALFCVGRFFGSPSLSVSSPSTAGGSNDHAAPKGESKGGEGGEGGREEEDLDAELREYLEGRSKVPLPTFFITGGEDSERSPSSRPSPLRAAADAAAAAAADRAGEEAAARDAQAGGRLRVSALSASLAAEAKADAAAAASEAAAAAAAAVMADGCELCPNLTYLGAAGRRDVGGLSVCFLSGVFDPDFYGIADPTEARDLQWRDGVAAKDRYREEDVQKLLMEGRFLLRPPPY